MDGRTEPQGRTTEECKLDERLLSRAAPPKKTRKLNPAINIESFGSNPVVIIFRTQNDAECEVLDLENDIAEMPYKLQIFIDHFIMYSMKFVTFNVAKLRRRKVWYSDFMALNEVLKQIHEGSIS